MGRGGARLGPRFDALGPAGHVIRRSRRAKWAEWSVEHVKSPYFPPASRRTSMPRLRTLLAALWAAPYYWAGYRLSGTNRFAG